jgi:hypothetical protein
MKNTEDFKMILLFIFCIIGLIFLYISSNNIEENCKGYIVKDAFWGWSTSCIEKK